MAFKAKDLPLTGKVLKFPSPDGVMAFKGYAVCISDFHGSFPSPDGVMAFKGNHAFMFDLRNVRFRPLMGLWPLKGRP